MAGMPVLRGAVRVRGEDDFGQAKSVPVRIPAGFPNGVSSYAVADFAGNAVQAQVRAMLMPRAL